MFRIVTTILIEPMIDDAPMMCMAKMPASIDGPICRVSGAYKVHPAAGAPPGMKKLATSSRRLAELKGVAASIPNQGILINTLGLQEAKDSSAIENIVTTHDELFRDDVDPDAFTNPAAKEVLRYRQALRVGFEWSPRRRARGSTAASGS